MVFLDEYFEKVDFEKNQKTTEKKTEKFPSMQCCLLTLLSSSFYSVTVHLLLLTTVENNHCLFCRLLKCFRHLFDNSVDPNQTGPVGAV